MSDPLLGFKLDRYRIEFLAIFRKKERNKLRRYELQDKIVQYLEDKRADEKECQEIARWLKKHEIDAFPYSFTEKYGQISIEVYEEDGWNYVMYHGHKMYMKKCMTKKDIVNYMRGIMREQDEKSPHKYCYKEIDFKDKVVADCGVAEGFFSLDIVDIAKKIYMFECDNEWIEALKKTFAPYGDNKVVIVPKYIDNKCDELSTTVDAFFADKQLDAIKADIEGYETAMLAGAEDTFRNKINFALLCAYHRQADEAEIIAKLDKYGLNHCTTQGYMLFPDDNNQIEPYLRRGLIIATRSRNK